MIKNGPRYVRWKRCWAAKHKMAQSINSCIPFALYPQPFRKRQSPSWGYSTINCIKGTLKNNVKAEKWNSFIALVFTKGIGEIPHHRLQRYFRKRGVENRNYRWKWLKMKINKMNNEKNPLNYYKVFILQTRIWNFQGTTCGM